MTYPQIYNQSEKYHLVETKYNPNRNSSKNIKYEKQIDLTSRMSVYLLRSIGDILRELSNPTAIFWLHAARTLDPNAVCTYVSISNYYKSQLSETSTTNSETLLDYVYFLARAAALPNHPYQILKVQTAIKNCVKRKFHGIDFENEIEKLPKYAPVGPLGEDLEKVIYIPNKQYNPDGVSNDQARDICIFLLVKVIFMDEDCRNLAYFTQCLALMSHPIDPNWLVKVFIVALMGLVTFKKSTEEALLGICDSVMVWFKS